MTLEPGTTLNAYELIALLGQGGMGEVYLARDTTLGREVALKVLPANVAADPHRLARLQREARTLAALNHPNICTLYGFEEATISEPSRPGSADGQVPNPESRTPNPVSVSFLVMERVEGVSLDRMVPAGGLPVQRILELAIPIADALAAAHEKGIVHRDLKPANVMVAGDGRVKVLDFGLARVAPAGPPGSESHAATASATLDGGIAGTLPYMAPEQLRGDKADARADIFSFGTMLYEMAAGVRPFQSPTSAELVSAILRDDPPAIEAVRPDLPAPLVRLVRRCLEKDARRRVQSAIDLREELRDIADDLRSEAVAAHRASAAVAGPPSAAGIELAPATAHAGGAGTPLRARSWTRRVVTGLSAVAVAGAIVAAVLIVRGWKPWPAAPGASPAVMRVAVLPFDNMNHDASQDFFVDGIHEALITDLARRGTMKVTSRNSVMRYKGKALSLKEVAKELGVDALIEGSVLRVGDQVRITAQLILGTTDEHVWANRYDRRTEDVLALLSEVSGAIAGEVQTRLGGGGTTAAAATPAPLPRVRPEAYEAYLQGRYAINQASGRGELARALECFQRANALDPGFAAAWSGMAMTRAAMAFFGGMLPVASVAESSTRDARKALELDSRDGDAYAVLGSVALYHDWSPEAARPLLEEAVRLSPHDSWLRHTYADYFLVTGRFDTSLEEVRLGRDYDPGSPLAQWVVMFHTLAARRFDEAVAEARRGILQFPPMARMGHGMIGDVLWRQGKYDESLAEHRLALANDPEGWNVLEDTYKRSGPRAAMKAYAVLLDKRAGSEYRNAVSIAAAYADAGEPDLAMAWLDKAYAAHLPQVLHVPASPAFDPMKNDPRFRDFLRRVGIQQR